MGVLWGCCHYGGVTIMGILPLWGVLPLHCYRLIEDAVNRGVNDSSWIKCPPPHSGGDDMLYKDNSVYYTVLQVCVMVNYVYWGWAILKISFTITVQ